MRSQATRGEGIGDGGGDGWAQSKHAPSVHCAKFGELPAEGLRPMMVMSMSEAGAAATVSCSTAVRVLLVFVTLNRMSA